MLFLFFYNLFVLFGACDLTWAGLVISTLLQLMLNIIILQSRKK
ncbi:MAG: hypothetical protein KQ78_01808 [Candidatus Izimaplasma bacterium HR2]|nr:MAG: hypothetical protein KQ78_01808 [Candidatus Izimaplasma bacterium HR2]